MTSVCYSDIRPANWRVSAMHGLALALTAALLGTLQQEIKAAPSALSSTFQPPARFVPVRFTSPARLTATDSCLTRSLARLHCGFSSTRLALEGTAPHHLFDVGVFGQGLLLPWSTLS